MTRRIQEVNLSHRVLQDVVVFGGPEKYPTQVFPMENR
jgi:hypothetical protein